MHFRRLLHFSSIKNSYINHRMRAWHINEYGDLNQLKQSVVRMPALQKPTDLLIKIKATSVNPIDVAMTQGYGSKFINLLKSFKNGNTDSKFPLILGRDFSGIVVGKGHGCLNQLKLGDDVWGVIPVEQQGCHAHYVVVDNRFVSRKPPNLSYVQAASILYAGLTAWSSLWISGGLFYKHSVPNLSKTKILILGGSGGIGTLAIQIAKSWNSYVVTTCRTDAVQMLVGLGADVVIDYKQNDFDLKLKNEGPFSIILDCSKSVYEDIIDTSYSCNTYITLNPPFLKNFDEYGIVQGFTKNINSLLKSNVFSKNEKRRYVKWGFFIPSLIGINILQRLVQNQQITPVIEKIYKFDELHQAYQRVAHGHLRGKIVIEVDS